MIQRAFKNISRLKATSTIRIITTLFTSIMLILVFGQLGTDQRSIQSRNGLLNFIAISAVMIHVQSAGKLLHLFSSNLLIVLIFQEERNVFLREYSSRMYHSFTYFIATISSSVPGIFIYSTVGSLIYYFVVKLNTSSAERYFIHYGYHFLL